MPVSERKISSRCFPVASPWTIKSFDKTPMIFATYTTLPLATTANDMPFELLVATANRCAPEGVKWKVNVGEGGTSCDASDLCTVAKSTVVRIGGSIKKTVSPFDGAGTEWVLGVTVGETRNTSSVEVLVRGRGAFGSRRFTTNPSQVPTSVTHSKKVSRLNWNQRRLGVLSAIFGYRSGVGRPMLRIRPTNSLWISRSREQRIGRNSALYVSSARPK